MTENYILGVPHLETNKIRYVVPTFTCKCSEHLHVVITFDLLRSFMWTLWDTTFPKIKSVENNKSPAPKNWLKTFLNFM